MDRPNLGARFHQALNLVRYCKNGNCFGREQNQREQVQYWTMMKDLTKQYATA